MRHGNKIITWNFGTSKGLILDHLSQMSFVIMGELFNLTELQFPHLCNGDHAPSTELL